jgi:hypothetical protein
MRCELRGELRGELRAVIQCLSKTMCAMYTMLYSAVKQLTKITRTHTTPNLITCTVLYAFSAFQRQNLPSHQLQFSAFCDVRALVYHTRFRKCCF